MGILIMFAIGSAQCMTREQIDNEYANSSQPTINQAIDLCRDCIRQYIPQIDRTGWAYLAPIALWGSVRCGQNADGSFDKNIKAKLTPEVTRLALDLLKYSEWYFNDGLQDTLSNPFTRPQEELRQDFVTIRRILIDKIRPTIHIDFEWDNNKVNDQIVAFVVKLINSALDTDTARRQCITDLYTIINKQQDHDQRIDGFAMNIPTDDIFVLAWELIDMMNYISPDTQDLGKIRLVWYDLLKPTKADVAAAPEVLTGARSVQEPPLPEVTPSELVPSSAAAAQISEAEDARVAEVAVEAVEAVEAPEAAVETGGAEMPTAVHAPICARVAMFGIQPAPVVVVADAASLQEPASEVAPSSAAGPEVSEEVVAQEPVEGLAFVDTVSTANESVTSYPSFSSENTEELGAQETPPKVGLAKRLWNRFTNSELFRAVTGINQGSADLQVAPVEGVVAVVPKEEVSEGAHCGCFPKFPRLLTSFRNTRHTKANNK